MGHRGGADDLRGRRRRRARSARPAAALQPARHGAQRRLHGARRPGAAVERVGGRSRVALTRLFASCLRKPGGRHSREGGDRKSVVWGKSVAVRVDLGGRRSIKKKNTQKNTVYK